MRKKRKKTEGETYRKKALKKRQNDDLNLDQKKSHNHDNSYEFTKPRSSRSAAVEFSLGGVASLGIGLGLFFLLLWAGLYF